MNNPSGSQTLSTAGQTVCYSGTGTISLTIDANNITVLICGSGSDITISSIGGYGSSVLLEINANSTLNISATPYFLYGAESVVNYGTLNLSTTWNLNSSANLINASNTGTINLTGTSELESTGGYVYMNGGHLNVGGLFYIDGSSLVCLENNAMVSAATLQNAGNPGIVMPNSTASCIALTGGYSSSNDALISSSTKGALYACAEGSSSNYPASGSTSWGGAQVTFNCNTQCNLILPVSFEDFSLEVEQSKVVLNWSTASEEDSRYFQVERSADGILYTGIGTQPAAENSSSQINYSFTDYSPLTGINYYRITLLSAGGSSSNSSILLANLSARAEMKLITPQGSQNIKVLLPSGLGGTGNLRLIDM
jgi:hypothetical protein